MLTNMIAIVLASLPGILGMSLGATAGLTQSTTRRGTAFMLAGVGGILGYLVIAGCIWLLDQSGRAVFTTFNLSTLAVLTLASTGFWGWRWRGLCAARKLRGEPAFGLTPGMALPLALLFMLLGTALYQHVYMPVFAWDSLDWWVSQGGSFVAFDTDPATTSEPYPYDHYHPIAVVLIAAYSGFTGFVSGNGTGSLIPWLYAWMSLMMIVGGFARSMSSSVSVALLLAYLCGSIPLLENHMLAAGYAELWLTGVIVSAAALIALGLRTASIPYILVGCLMSFATVAIKNTGSAYAMAVLCALLVVTISKLAGKTTWIVLVITLTLLGAFLANGFDTSLGGSAFSLSYGDATVLEFAGRVWVFEMFSIADVLWNEFYSLVVNSSFSLWLVGVLFCTGWLITSAREPAGSVSEDLYGDVFLLLATLLTLALLAGSQLFFAYAFEHAKPGYDTGNSRFTLPAIGIGMLFMGAIVPRVIGYSHPR